MKKKLLLTLTVLGAFVFAGCGKKKTITNRTTIFPTVTKANNTTTKANTTKKNLDPVEYEHDNAIKHEIERDSNGNMISLKSSYKDKDDTNYKYYGRQDRVFNSSNLVTKYTFYKYDDVENNWVATYEIDYTYNSSGKVAVSIEKRLNEETNNLEIDLKTTYYYENGKEVSYEYAKYDGEKYVNTSKYNSVYEGNNVKTYTKQKWDKDTDAWVNVTKDENTFVTGLEMSFITYEWVDDAWVNKAKGEFEYYDNNKEKTYTWSEWNKSTSSFEYKSKSIYEYNEATRTTIQTTQYFIAGAWKYQSRYETTDLYEGGLSYESISKQFNSTTNSWENTSKFISIGDKYDGYVGSISYTWNSEIEDWVESID